MAITTNVANGEVLSRDHEPFAAGYISTNGTATSHGSSDSGSDSTLQLLAQEPGYLAEYPSTSHYATTQNGSTLRDEEILQFLTHGLEPTSNLAVPPPLGLPNTADSGYFFQVREGIMCARSTFSIAARACRYFYSNMHVEYLDPLMSSGSLPIILIHGDFHTGQIWLTKPDGDPGWASYFCSQGTRVYVVDLPSAGRSPVEIQPPGLAQSSYPAVHLDPGQVERELTAPGKQAAEGWDGVRNHSQWPGSGQAGDAIFDSYCASLVPLQLTKLERQTLARNALASLLQHTGRAVLVGEGAGATMAWLAADCCPDLVAAVVAVEPAGPPAGTAATVTKGARRYSPHITLDLSLRPYGLAEIPLTYDPPIEKPNAGPADGNFEAAIDLVKMTWPDNIASCFLQRSSEMVFPDMSPEETPIAVPRKLKNLCKMRHAVVTGHASSHSTYDWATIEFMRQAGVSVLNIGLETYRIFGNGHLMFLERNSDEIASLIGLWIDMNAKNEPEELD